MSAITHYKSLTKKSKRWVWLGYLTYLVFMVFFDGFDIIVEKIIPTGNAVNDVLQILVFLTLYWVVVLLVLWATND